MHSNLDRGVSFVELCKRYTSVSRGHLPEVLPQYPFAEQQSPNVLSWQVALISELEPQFPSVDIAPRLVDAADVEVEVLSDVAVVVKDSSLDEQLPNILWHLLKSMSATSKSVLECLELAMPPGLTPCSPR